MKLYFLIGPQTKEARLHYVIRLLGNTLGYPWMILDESAQGNEPGIVLSYRGDYSAVPPDSGSVIDIYNSGQLHDLKNARKTVSQLEYGENQIPLIGNRFKAQQHAEWKAQNNGGYLYHSGGRAWLIPFDLYTNIFFHVSRFEEKDRRTATETVRDHTDSLLFRYGRLALPVVDALIAYLDNIIREIVEKNKHATLRVMNWPGGEDCGVALTHDIDLTRVTGLKQRTWQTGAAIIRKVLGDRNAVKKARSEMNRLDAEAWCYPQLLDFYTRKKWKATFFILAKRFEGLHYRYNIRSPKFRLLFENLKNENHEIGLHSSLNAADNQNRYPLEKRKLEISAGSICSGLRQHYLRALYPGLWRWAEAAHFDYDSSLGYNHHPGFRAGTCHPFYTFDWEQDRALALLEFPLAFFDHSILPDPAKRFEARQMMNRIISQVTRFHGLLVVLLHPSNYLQPEHRETWDALMAELVEKRIYQDTLAGHFKWYGFKERIELIHEKFGAGDEAWTINKPVGLRTFSVEIIGAADLRMPADVQIEKIAARKYTLTSDRSRLELHIKRE
jgi:hypothetical protein